jgi:hypothetical protein
MIQAKNRSYISATSFMPEYISLQYTDWLFESLICGEGECWGRHVDIYDKREREGSHLNVSQLTLESLIAEARSGTTTCYCRHPVML